MRVLIAGGGTGGHFYPALAMIDGLRARKSDVRVAYVGTRRGIEARILPSHAWVEFHPICARGYAREGLVERLRFFVSLFVGFVQTLVVFARFRPQLVIGVGGYSSFLPVLLGALLGRFLSIRTAIHEQNAVAGMANRWLSRWVDVVMTSYPESKAAFRRARRVVLTGNPVREEFLYASRSEESYAQFGLDPKRKTVLVFGGSNGSAELIEQVLMAKQELAGRDGVQVLLVTGEEGLARSVQEEFGASGVENVSVRAYIDKMAAAFAVADLIVARAGATTLAEITTCGKAAVLVPWREAVDNHQWENARVLEREEACQLADGRIMVEHGLVNLVLHLVEDEVALSRLAGNARRLGQRTAGSLIQGEIETLLRGARA
jgi:UDP-N-acetylglucosamine--N-acetylmuramyl-(pentapeptide) pyrophosphoryl-undecaprenol N-acetylglucosamine transferase